MRKFISLGLFALFLSTVPGQVFGDVEDCEILKDGHTKGLYGLCIAYYNAGNENAQGRILENYERKRKAGDPDLPGTGDETEIECPCWTAIELADATDGETGAFCVEDETLLAADTAIYVGTLVSVFAGYTVFPIDPAGGTECLLINNGSQIQSTTTAEEDAVCRAGVRALQMEEVEGVPVFPPCS